LSDNEPYPFESDDDIEIRELDLEDVDALGEKRITVSQLAGENESWRYGHVIVDEAQDLSPMQWRMVMRRVRGRSLTIVGDLAQRSASTVERWEDLLPKELAGAQRQDLTVNYRSPVEIHELSVAVLADYAPGIVPSVAIRASGFTPGFHPVHDVHAALDSLIDQSIELVGGLVAVISAGADELVSAHHGPDGETGRVRFLTPNQAKGLEFDAVILVEPNQIWASRGGEAQLYIALTRATQRLTIVYAEPLPAPLRSH
jgi:DNA helicase IV